MNRLRRWSVDVWDRGELSTALGFLFSLIYPSYNGQVLEINKICMNQEFASDLNNARLESSLSYEDCVHLLDMTVKRFKQLESGSVIPTLNELCALNILFNQAFESLYNDIFDEVKAHMNAALENMPGENEPECSDITRQTSLNSLSERLQGFRIGDYGS